MHALRKLAQLSVVSTLIIVTTAERHLRRLQVPRRTYGKMRRCQGQALRQNLGRGNAG